MYKYVYVLISVSEIIHLQDTLCTPQETKAQHDFASSQNHHDYLHDHRNISLHARWRILLALHLKDRLHLILGFSAGAILAVAFFDLLPEALKLAGNAYSVTTVLFLVVIGFTSYLET